MDRDDGLAGAGTTGDAGRAAVVAERGVTLRRVQVGPPLRQRLGEHLLQLVLARQHGELSLRCWRLDGGGHVVGGHGSGLDGACDLAVDDLDAVGAFERHDCVRLSFGENPDEPIELLLCRDRTENGNDIGCDAEIDEVPVASVGEQRDVLSCWWLCGGDRCVDLDHVQDLQRAGGLVDLEGVVHHPSVDLVVGADVGEDEQVVVADVENHPAVVAVDADGPRTRVLGVGVRLEVDALARPQLLRRQLAERLGELGDLRLRGLRELAQPR